MTVADFNIHVETEKTQHQVFIYDLDSAGVQMSPLAALVTLWILS